MRTHGWGGSSCVATVCMIAALANPGFAQNGAIRGDTRNTSPWDMLQAQESRDGIAGTVWTVLAYGGQVVAGGDFVEAGGVPANHIARWTGSGWEPLGLGVNGIVYTLCEYGGNLVAGGTFTMAGGLPAAHIALWDGSEWEPLGQGVAGAVRALVVHGADLVVGGDFWEAGGIAANQIAFWDGAAWAPLGDGFSGGYNGLGVRALTEYDGCIVAGGFFTLAGSSVADHIAYWDDSQWINLGGGWNEEIYALKVFEGDLVAGSVVWNVGQGSWESLIRRWNGTTWIPMGSGVLDEPFPNAVRVLEEYGGQLYAGGQFLTAGGRFVRFLAAWDGIAWGPVNCGTNNNVFALTAFDNVLVIGGEFTSAGRQLAEHIAAWDGGNWLRMAMVPEHDDALPETLDSSIHVEPNPARGTVRIIFAVPPGSTRSVGIYDLTGRLLRSLSYVGDREGLARTEWDRRTSTGMRASAGTYVVSTVAGDARIIALE